MSSLPSVCPHLAQTPPPLTPPPRCCQYFQCLPQPRPLLIISGNYNGRFNTYLNDQWMLLCFIFQVCNKIIFLMSFVGNRGTFTRGYKAMVMDFEFLYHLLYLIICTLGVFVHVFFYSLLVRETHACSHTCRHTYKHFLTKLQPNRWTH